MSNEIICDRVTNSEDNHINKNTNFYWKFNYKEIGSQKNLTEYR